MRVERKNWREGGEGGANSLKEARNGMTNALPHWGGHKTLLRDIYSRHTFFLSAPALLTNELTAHVSLKVIKDGSRDRLLLGGKRRATLQVADLITGRFEGEIVQTDFNMKSIFFQLLGFKFDICTSDS
ncbi:hypothetical protein CDAR_409731 [Caerostris darwini]|uniref:Uncharacterized protein n=1 Tax=Caerostris darwini TaxID=1538125 RepID=A0AAV4VL05_9ARAC|nr:hypothetical protein CDAR_409731 [Caerostris darwini]